MGIKNLVDHMIEKLSTDPLWREFLLSLDPGAINSNPGCSEIFNYAQLCQSCEPYNSIHGSVYPSIISTLSMFDSDNSVMYLGEYNSYYYFKLPYSYEFTRTNMSNEESPIISVDNYHNSGIIYGIHDGVICTSDWTDTTDIDNLTIGETYRVSISIPQRIVASVAVPEYVAKHIHSNIGVTVK